MSEELLIEKYFDRLWPICRSITGNGLRDSLRIISELIPLQISEVPSGTAVFDWEVPEEWNVRDAYIITPDGRKICVLSENNLHLVNYSVAINTDVTWEDLNPHLYTLKGQSNAIPYVTSYYKKHWGFCLTQKLYETLPHEGNYKVFIDSTHEQGSLSYGDFVLKGKTDKEILISTYLCHPSMANNELSGPLVAAFLYRQIATLPERKFTYRFVFAPETIGIIAYLAKHGMHMKEKLHAGYVLTCCGDPGNLTYKRSRQANTAADRVAEHVLAHSGKQFRVKDFEIGGSDERQYCSPGFNLPVGSLMRTPYKEFSQYHTSLDNKDFISFSAMMDSVMTLTQIIKVHELNDYYESLNPFCEPRLGKRGLYSELGAYQGVNEESTMRILHLMAHADGKTDLISIAEKGKKSALAFEKEIAVLQRHQLLK